MARRGALADEKKKESPHNSLVHQMSCTGERSLVIYDKGLSAGEAPEVKKKSSTQERLGRNLTNQERDAHQRGGWESEREGGRRTIG